MDYFDDWILSVKDMKISHEFAEFLKFYVLTGFLLVVKKWSFCLKFLGIDDFDPTSEPHLCLNLLFA